MHSPDLKFLFPCFLVFPLANPSTLQMFFYPDIYIGSKILAVIYIGSKILAVIYRGGLY